MARLKLEGYRSAAEVEDLFANVLVDIAYVDEVTDNAIYVIGDVGSDDYLDPDTFKWASELIREVLATWHCDVSDLRISLENAPAGE
ncbi:MAG TPA: hypothetical protein VGP63_10995 [Planctomycetaceae bacterium]|jgi:hypothetical protein|nr:hypothetical protein [Planctomycetaceae bacterium]